MLFMTPADETYLPKYHNLPHLVHVKSSKNEHAIQHMSMPVNFLLNAKLFTETFKLLNSAHRKTIQIRTLTLCGKECNYKQMIHESTML